MLETVLAVGVSWRVIFWAEFSKRENKRMRLAPVSEQEKACVRKTKQALSFHSLSGWGDAVISPPCEARRPLST